MNEVLPGLPPPDITNWAGHLWNEASVREVFRRGFDAGKDHERRYPQPKATEADVRPSSPTLNSPT